MVESAPEALIDLTLPSDPRYLALVRVVVGAAAGAVPSLTDARVADLKLVATELFANAMEANWRSARSGRAAGSGSGSDRSVEQRERGARGPAVPEESAPVRVTCRADAEGVTLTVADSGPGLDATDDLHPPVEDPTRLHHERGLGLPLIQYLADKVDYVSDSGGTSATVVLRDRGD
ncbi:MAG TPA: ATP-binding protein, partial [Acidimicrobiales bacterium]|nr:ATP-binding protein [Acidimicrobiales bacterium]